MSGDKQKPLSELLLTVGAIWLAFRGDDPAKIAATAQRAANTVHGLLTRLEQMSDEHIRDLTGCDRTERCECLYCEARKKDQATC